MRDGSDYSPYNLHIYVEHPLNIQPIMLPSFVEQNQSTTINATISAYHDRYT